MTVDRDSALPLWAQVLGDLRRRLAAGEFRLRFPGDTELTEHYGVSRHTVREAVRRLQHEGVVERGRGRGTFVRDGAIEQPLGALYSLFRSVEEQGFVQRSVVRYLETRQDEEAAKVLGRAPDEPLVYLERLRLADEVPIVLDCSWLPAALASRCSRWISPGPRCTASSPCAAGYARTPAGSGSARSCPNRSSAPCWACAPGFRRLAIERLATWQTTPVEWRHGLVRADRFSYVARWSAQDKGAELPAFAWQRAGTARADRRYSRPKWPS